MAAVIISNGTIEDYSYCRKYIDGADLIICADGGARHAAGFGITPHVLIGDFDSITQDDCGHFSSLGVETVRFPAEKDRTDTELAVDYAIKKGFRSIIIIGGLGTRMDHSLANIFLLKKMLDAGVTGMLADERNEVLLVRDRVSLRKEEGMKVTLLPLSESAGGIITRGLYYPLDGDTLGMGSTRGVSNEFEGETAEISVAGGLLLVIKSRD